MRKFKNESKTIPFLIKIIEKISSFMAICIYISIGYLYVDNIFFMIIIIFILRLILLEITEFLNDKILIENTDLMPLENEKSDIEHKEDKAIDSLLSMLGGFLMAISFIQMILYINIGIFLAKKEYIISAYFFIAILLLIILNYLIARKLKTILIDQENKQFVLETSDDFIEIINKN